MGDTTVILQQIPITTEHFNRLSTLISSPQIDRAYDYTLLSRGYGYSNLNMYVSIKIDNSWGKPLLVLGSQDNKSIGEMSIPLHGKTLNEVFQVTFTNGITINIQFIIDDTVE